MRVTGQTLVGPWMLSRKEAQTAFRQKFAAPEPPTPNGQTLRTFATPLLSASWHKSYATTTLDLHRQNLRSRILTDPIADLLLETIAANPDVHVAAFLARQSGSRSTINNVMDSLRAVLRQADITTAVKAPRKLASPQPFVSNAMYEQLATVAGQNPVDWRDVVIVCALFEMGLRREELAAVRHEDRISNSLRISRAAVVTSKGVEIKGLKDDGQVARLVPVPPALSEFIGSATGYLVGWTDEIPMRPPAINYRVRRLAQLAGLTLPPRWGAHAFRRGIATEMLGAGVDVKQAAAITGHSVEVLLKHYAQSTETGQHDAIARARGRLKITKMITKPGS